MRIPLPDMMRHWRERDYEHHNPPLTQRLALKAWAWTAKRPRLYQTLTGIAMPLLARLGRHKGRFRHLPLAGGWTKGRDFPAPQGKTFQQLWRARRKAKP